MKSLVPIKYVDDLKKKISKLQNRAEKIGADPIVMQFGDTHNIPVKHIKNMDDIILWDCADEMIDAEFKDNDLITISYMPAIDVIIEGDNPKYQDWEFLATMDHQRAGGSLVRVGRFSEVEEDELTHIAKEYSKHGNVCEHCNIDRYRKTTYLVRNTQTHEVKQVGSSCIQDFLGGKSPEAIAAYFDHLTKFYSDIINPDPEYWSDYIGGAHFDQSLLTVVAMSDAIVSQIGYMSKTKAREAEEMGEYKTSTADLVNAIMHQSQRWAKETLEHYGLSDLEITDQHYDHAKAIIQWFREEAKGSNSYMINMITLFQNDTIEERNIGFAVSAVPTYIRAMQKEKEQKKEIKNSEWVGIKSEKIETDVEVKNIVGCDTEWGYSVLIIFEDHNGNILKWFSGSDAAFNMNHGDNMKIRAKVKDHDTWNGIKQTQINYVKVLKEEKETNSGCKEIYSCSNKQWDE